MKGYKKTKIGVIPQEWEVKRLGEVLKIGSGKDYKHLNNGDIPVYGTGGYMLSVDSYLYDGESVCIGRKGTIDKPRFLKGKFWTVDTLFYSYDFLNSIPKYIYYIFLTINWKKYNEASGVPSLSKKIIENIKIPLPPIDEQQKIAEILSTWDEAIEKQESLIKEKENLKKGLMQQLLTGKVRFKEFSEEWKEVKLGEVCEIKKGQQLNKLELSEIDKYPVINGGINPSGYTNNYNTNENTITISEGGNSCGFVNYIKTKFWSGGHCYILENILEIDKIYLYFYLKFEEIKIMRLRVGSGLPNIQKKDIENFKLTLPSLKEQQKIAEVLSTIDKEIELLKDELNELKNQKKGLMQKLLSGEVRVKIKGKIK